MDVGRYQVIPTDAGDYIVTDGFGRAVMDGARPARFATRGEAERFNDASRISDARHGRPWVATTGDTFAGFPLEPGTLILWDSSAVTHYPAGLAELGPIPDVEPGRCDPALLARLVTRFPWAPAIYPAIAEALDAFDCCPQCGTTDVGRFAQRRDPSGIFCDDCHA